MHANAWPNPAAMHAKIQLKNLQKSNRPTETTCWPTEKPEIITANWNQCDLRTNWKRKKEAEIFSWANWNDLRVNWKTWKNPNSQLKTLKKPMGQLKNLKNLKSQLKQPAGQLKNWTKS